MCQRCLPAVAHAEWTALSSAGSSAFEEAARVAASGAIDICSASGSRLLTASLTIETGACCVTSLPATVQTMGVPEGQEQQLGVRR